MGILYSLLFGCVSCCTAKTTKALDVAPSPKDQPHTTYFGITGLPFRMYDPATKQASQVREMTDFGVFPLESVLYRRVH